METNPAASLHDFGRDAANGDSRRIVVGESVVWIIPFKADHVLMFERAEAGAGAVPSTIAQLKGAEGKPHSYTVLVNGGIVACAGIVQYWGGRGEAWAIINKLSKRQFLVLHRVVKNYLDQAPFHRVEATVFKAFENGHRWMKTLGFTLEAETLKAYSENKQDYSLYARVK